MKSESDEVRKARSDGEKKGGSRNVRRQGRKYFQQQEKNSVIDQKTDTAAWGEDYNRLILQ